MKKYFILAIVCILAISLTGCAHKTVIENGQKVEYINGFKVIKIFNELAGCSTVRLVCDPETKVMYYMTGSTESNSFDLTPYYIVKDGKGEIAIYGRNYFG